VIVGIGIDLLTVARMERALGRTGERFLSRVFTGDERAACEAAGGGAERWAARFAAKEAVLKALGTGWSGGVAWRQVEILTAPGEAPSVRLSGRAREVARHLGAGVCHVSLSHEKLHAAAVAVLEGALPEGAG
jgi:holo-[acyl-carrier protein] synthase